MTNHQLYVPIGLVEEKLSIRSSLAARYYDFLKTNDPLDRWEDLTSLETPISIEKTYVYENKLANEYFSILPQLPRVLQVVQQYDALAPLLGFRYAWTRLPMHIELLNSLESLIRQHDYPTSVIEPGCFCAGLSHFLPEAIGVPYTGIDLSPVALDVCRKIEKHRGLGGKRILLRADIQAVSAESLEASSKQTTAGSVMLVCNLLNNVAGDWHLYPSFDGMQIAAWLVSYWVNAGATVIVCERCDDPQEYVGSLVQNGLWLRGGAAAEILAEFETICTVGMTPSSPLGRWEKVNCVVVRFSRN